MFGLSGYRNSGHENAFRDAGFGLRRRFWFWYKIVWLRLLRFWRRALAFFEGFLGGFTLIRLFIPPWLNVNAFSFERKYFSFERKCFSFERKYFLFEG